MKFYWILLLVSPLAALTRLPDEFTVVERFFSLTQTFDIQTDLGPLATARKEILSLTSSFVLEDPLGNRLASAKARFFGWGTIADIYDAEGLPIGRIEEVIWRILPWAEYKVFDAQDRLTVVARMNFLGTHFDLFPPENPEMVYATVERPFIRIFRDYWTVQIRNLSVFEEGTIDPRLLIILAVFQTDKDNRDRLRREILETLRSHQDQNEGT